MAIPGGKFLRTINVVRSSGGEPQPPSPAAYLINIRYQIAYTMNIHRIIPVNVWIFGSDELVLDKSYVFTDESTINDIYDNTFSYVSILSDVVPTESILDFYLNEYAPPFYEKTEFSYPVKTDFPGPQGIGITWGYTETNMVGSATVHPLGKLTSLSSLTFPPAQVNETHDFAGLGGPSHWEQVLTSPGGTVDVPYSFKVLVQADFDQYPSGSGPYSQSGGVIIAKNVVNEDSSLVLYLIDPDTLPDPDEL